MPIAKLSKFPRKAKKILETLSPKAFYEKRNRVLIVRNTGGLGDILMHRMMFEDFHDLMPDIKLDFACPKQYHDAVADHPFLNRVLDVETVNRQDYFVWYNTSTICGRYEMKISPKSDKHRSDIWANHCGVELKKHEMHFRLTEHELANAKDLLSSKRYCSGPIVLFSPISAMVDKNLSDVQIRDVICGLKERKCCVIGLHYSPILEFIKNDVPVICGINLRQWMAVIQQSNYVISVDTSQFHCAGGMKKPTLGIFTFVNGSTYGKYYKKALILQGPCPLGHCGCYDWGICPAKNASPKPCGSGITAEMILKKVDTMLAAT